jgi:DUF1365 family protein
MALPQTYGVDHVFGLYSTEDFITLQADDFSTKVNVDVTVTDETGRIITDRLDDKQIDVTLSGILKAGATMPVVGNQIVYNTVTYIIKSVDDNGTNNSFRKVTVKGVKYQQIA